jgi:indolepyruvate ferredoxin oxidoreductase alpha subunit
MTGAQDNPGTGQTLMKESAPQADIMAICKGLGIRRVREIDAYDLQACESALREEASYDEPSVLLTKRPCMQLVKIDPARALRVNKDCIGCGACLRLGCPALSRGEEISKPGAKKPLYKAVIDEAACAGCTMCAQLCPKKAIEVIS